jgi:hypothetical protein
MEGYYLEKKFHAEVSKSYEGQVWRASNGFKT